MIEKCCYVVYILVKGTLTLNQQPSRLHRCTPRDAHSLQPARNTDMCMCIYIYLFICLLIYTYTYIYTYIHKCAYTYLYIYTHISLLFRYVYIYMYNIYIYLTLQAACWRRCSAQTMEPGPPRGQIGTSANRPPRGAAGSSCHSL